MKESKPYEYRTLLSAEEYKPESTLNAFSNCRLIQRQFEKAATAGFNYSLRKHTLSVLDVFETYFSSVFELGQRNCMRMLLALHDIGKPMAIQRGDKTLQHRFTIRIINRLPDRWVGSSQRNWLCTLLADDYLGDFLKGNYTEEQCLLRLRAAHAQSGADKAVFFNHLSVYYQCDVAGYTRLGDLTCALDCLFQWNEALSAPVFDNTVRLFRFSPPIQSKFELIRKEFLNHA